MTPTPSSPALLEEIKALLYSFEIPHVLNPHNLQLEDLIVSIIHRERKKAAEEAFAKLDVPKPNESDYRIAGESSTEFMDSRSGGLYDGEVAMWHGFQEKKAVVLAKMFPSQA